MEKDQQCTARFTGNQMFNCVDLAQKEVFARYLADPLPWPEVMGKLKGFFPISEVWYIWYAVQTLPHSLSPFPLPFFWFSLLEQCRLFDAFCDRLRLLLCLYSHTMYMFISVYRL
ncbi:hypothetical protein SORBI_3008G100801 [Sorghum bicolor]|uniref:Uncharacterized protein n=1 Tax=Sorghum bicolor TaxID=4558 RepID=A0A1Z5R710_SORBI|nr:hypothetical protein SORBI_3008G100801 [Sorghum bicolor]